MQEVLKYIHNNIKEHLVAADVAEHFGYSKWYFSEKKLFFYLYFSEKRAISRVCQFVDAYISVIGLVMN